MRLIVSSAGRLLPVICVLALAGCSIPIPQAEKDPTRFYVLSPTSAPATGTAAAGGPAILLRPVELASYLRSRPMIVRRGGNEIEFRDFARWGEPLEQGISRVLREELLARGAAASVQASGLRGGNSANELELTVRVLAFEGGADGAVVMRAVWELTNLTAKTAVGRGDYRASVGQWDAKDEAALAARLSEAIGELAQEISAAVKK